MTERKADRDLLGIVVAVADKDILAIGNTLVIARKVQIAGVVLQTEREGLSQMSAGVGLAVQQLVGGLTDALAAEIQFQNGRDAVGPRQLDRAAVVQDHDHMGLDLCDLVDQAILAGGQLHRSAVIPFRLKRFGQTGKDNGDIGVLCRLNGLGQLCVGHLVPHRREALGVADVAALLLRNLPRGGARGWDGCGWSRRPDSAVPRQTSPM